MSEINIKVEALSEAIKKLHDLQKRVNQADRNFPTTVGGGAVVNELEAIAGVYKSLNDSLDMLISNTAFFMQNVKDSYVASDQKIANKFSGSGLGDGSSFDGGSGGGAGFGGRF